MSPSRLNFTCFTEYGTSSTTNSLLDKVTDTRRVRATLRKLYRTRSVKGSSNNADPKLVPHNNTGFCTKSLNNCIAVTCG